MNTKTHVIIIMIILLMGFVSSVSYANGQHKKTKIPVPLLGISLPEQRSIRWVHDKRAMEEYAKEKKIPVIIRFSDNDIYLQTYQIDSLINSDITMLIVASPQGYTLNKDFLEVLKLAKLRGIFVIAYDTIIMNSMVIDFFISFEYEDYPKILTESRQIVDLTSLREIVAGTRESMKFYDTAQLGRIAIDMAIQFSYQQPKRRNYIQVKNGVKEISSLLLAPKIITKNNYIEQLINPKIVKDSDVIFSNKH